MDDCTCYYSYYSWIFGQRIIILDEAIFYYDSDGIIHFLIQEKNNLVLSTKPVGSTVAREEDYCSLLITIS